MRGLRGFVGGVVSICSNTYLTMGGSSSHPREAGAGSSMTVTTVSQRCWHPLEGGVNGRSPRSVDWIQCGGDSTRNFLHSIARNLQDHVYLQTVRNY